MTLPAHPDLERLVIGYALIEPERMDSLRAIVEPDDFSLDTHRGIWRLVCELYDAGKGIDYVTVQKAAMAANQDNYGGLSYLVSLCDFLPQNAAIGGYLERLKDATLRRRMMHAAHHLELLAADEAQPADEVMEKFATASLELARGSAGKANRPISTREMIETEGVTALLTPRDQGGIRLPWSELNRSLCGLSAGQMVVLMAATGRGKTCMALQIATAAATQGHTPVIWNMEMGPRSLFQRMTTQISGSPATRRKTTFQEREEQHTALAQLGDYPIYFDRSSRSVAAFTASLRQVRTQTKLGLGVVDYLGLIRGSGGKGSRAQEVSDNSRALKLAALDLGIPILVLSQVDRSSVKGGGAIGLHSAKESGDIENDADVVLWIEGGELSREQPTSVALHLGKQREGPAGFSIPMVFFPASQSFQEAAQDDNA